MISKTKIKLRTRRKTNPELTETIRLANKNPEWKEVATILSNSTKKHSKINLNEIAENSDVGDTIIVPGKVLSLGDLTNKVKICSLSISEKAKSKLADSKSESTTILSEIKKNPKAEGIKIIK